MTKDLSDVVSDLKAAETKINKTPAPKKLEQAELPNVFKSPDGKTMGITSQGEVYDVDEAKKKLAPKKAATKTEDKPAETKKAAETMTREDKIMELLTHFCLECGHMDFTKAGDKIATKYPRPEAWKYLADIAGYYTRVENTKYCGWQNNPCAYRVEATCSLVRKKDDVVVTTVTMCAASDEEWLKNKGIEAAYGLAITRAESRAVRSHLGHYMACVGLSVTPYEEMGDRFMDLETV